MSNSKVAISGGSGFVGSYLSNCFSPDSLILFDRDAISNNFYFNETLKINAFIHLAGKAHDIKKVLSSDEYYKVNTELTKIIFDAFLSSNAKVFITLSSVKAVADEVDGVLVEDASPNPITHYGKSKLLAEQYIISKVIPEDKRVYILRPCMIHGPGNRGNLNLLYKIVSRGFPWPLGAFENKRSLCSIDNLCFIIRELIDNDQIPSGIYNISDDEPVSTNEIIKLISQSQGKTPFILKIPKLFIFIFSKIGNLLRLPLNAERLNKLTETYIVSNDKILQAINKPLPLSAKEGLIKTFDSFEKDKHLLV